MPHLTLQFRRGTASQWATANPILAIAEMGIETDTNNFKIGDGTSQWNSLQYGGIVGPTGPTGPTGSTGDMGVTGPTGATINIVNPNANYLLYSDGSTTNIDTSESLLIGVDGSLIVNSNISLASGGVLQSSIFRASTNTGWQADQSWSLNPITDTIIFDMENFSTGEYWANIGTGIDGQNLKVIYYNGSSSNVCNVSANFGTRMLGTGSGLLSTIYFKNTGESAQLIYMANENIWQIINTGATVIY